MQTIRAIYSILIVIVSIISITEGEIGPDIASSIKIVSQFCRPFHHFTMTAEKFFSCYNGVTGREHFLKCQIQEFGSNPNTMCNAEQLCNKTKGGMEGFGPYNDCIIGEFKNANIDLSLLIEAGTHINKCQAAVVGVE